MLTDTPSRKHRAGFLESDRIKTLDVPPNGDLFEVAKRLEAAMKANKIPDVRSACTEFLATASGFYKAQTVVSVCSRLDRCAFASAGHLSFSVTTAGTRCSFACG
jgi:hypothetical protein